ncbi:MAG: hypothetical protein HC809_06255, partial [Gammaproteobacteria bacterium]|nr:hypothetical protein [Gammaproteobacteria bacterium]
MSQVAVQPGDTATQPIRLTTDGDRQFYDFAAGVLATYTLDADARALIAAADVLMTPLYEQIEELFESVMRAPTHALRVVDFADIADDPRIERVLAFVDRLDIAFLSLDPTQTDFRIALQTLAADCDKLFVITLGAGGSIAASRSATVVQPALAVPRVVDTTGA